MTFEGLKRRLYLVAFVDEFGPLYVVYTLWFNDNGVSTAQISAALLVWAVFALVFEVPSGALADRVDRRHLIGWALVTRMVAISVWLVWPTFAGLLVGAILWAAHDATASGAWEAMIHDQVSAVGHADGYQPVMARIGQFGHIGLAAGTLLGAWLLSEGVGIEALGWLTAAVHLGSIAGVLSLPDAGRIVAGAQPPEPAPSTPGTGPIAGPILSDVVRGRQRKSLAAWWATLRQGVDDARHTPVIARLVVIGAMLEGLFILDEYVPLVARARGGADSTAPIIVFVVWIGLLVGGEIAARRTTISSPVLGMALIAGVAITTLAYIASSVWALMLVAVGYATLELVWIASDARMQERVPFATRATVTSVRGFGGATVSLLAFAIIGLMSDGDDPTPGHFVVLAALIVTGALVVRWLPKPVQQDP